MSPAARSVFIFGWYVVLLGVVLVVIPNLLLETFGLGRTDEVWVHVLGLVLCAIGLYYVKGATANLLPFFQWTVWARWMIFAGLAAFAAMGMVSPVIILFGAIDAAGAIWTTVALRKGARDSAFPDALAG